MICKAIPQGCVFLLMPTKLLTPLRAGLWDQSCLSCVRAEGGQFRPSTGKSGSQPDKPAAAKPRVRPPSQPVVSSGGACGSQAGCRLNKPPFLKRVVPEGQGCLQWCGSVRGNGLTGCFHNAWTVNKFRLLYSGFPSVSHQKCE